MTVLGQDVPLAPAIDETVQRAQKQREEAAQTAQEKVDAQRVPTPKAPARGAPVARDAATQTAIVQRQADEETSRRNFNTLLLVVLALLALKGRR